MQGYTFPYGSIKIDAWWALHDKGVLLFLIYFNNNLIYFLFLPNDTSILSLTEGLYHEPF